MPFFFSCCPAYHLYPLHPILLDWGGLYRTNISFYLTSSNSQKYIHIRGQVFKPRNRVMCTAVPLVQSYIAGKTNNYFLELLMVDRKINILFMCMERSICEALPFILSKKSAFFQVNVIHFVTRASAIHFLPLFWWLLTLPET